MRLRRNPAGPASPVAATGRAAPTGGAEPILKVENIRVRYRNGALSNVLVGATTLAMTLAAVAFFVTGPG